MGSKSSASTATTSNQYDNRVINDLSNGGLQVGGNYSSSVSVKSTDQGAMKAAIKLQQQAFQNNDKNSNRAFAFATLSQKGSFDAMSKAMGAVGNAYIGAKGDANASNDIAKLAIGAAALMAVAITLKG